jgi:hypothetical protein
MRVFRGVCSPMRFRRRFGGRGCMDKFELPLGGLLLQSRPCQTAVCPRSCEVGDWVCGLEKGAEACKQTTGCVSSTCSRSCGGGVVHCGRNILQDQSIGGSRCPQTEKTIACNTQPCPTDCIVGTWDCTAGKPGETPVGYPMGRRHACTVVLQGLGKTCGHTTAGVRCSRKVLSPPALGGNTTAAEYGVV